MSSSGATSLSFRHPPGPWVTPCCHFPSPVCCHQMTCVLGNTIQYKLKWYLLKRAFQAITTTMVKFFAIPAWTISTKITWSGWVLLVIRDVQRHWQWELLYLLEEHLEEHLGTWRSERNISIWALNKSGRQTEPSLRVLANPHPRDEMLQVHKANNRPSSKQQSSCNFKSWYQTGHLARFELSRKGLRPGI